MRMSPARSDGFFPCRVLEMKCSVDCNVRLMLNVIRADAVTLTSMASGCFELATFVVKTWKILALSHPIKVTSILHSAMPSQVKSRFV